MSRKKHRKEEVKEKILEYLGENREATKYRVKEDLRIPLSTVLHAVDDLEKEGLVEHSIGKRGSHVCSLTLKGLTRCLDKNIINLEDAKEVFLEMLGAKGMAKEEIMEKLGIPEKGLSGYVKLYLNFLLNRSGTLWNLLDLDRTIKDIESGEPSSDGSFLNSGWILAVNLMETFSRSGGTMDGLMLPLPPSLPSLYSSKLLLHNCSDEELDELLSWLAKRERSNIGTLAADLLDNYLLKKAGKPSRARKWIEIGCMPTLLEFDLKPLVKSLVSSGSEPFFVKAEIINSIRMANCPVDNAVCDFAPSERVKCRKFRELLKRFEG